MHQSWIWDSSYSIQLGAIALLQLSEVWPCKIICKGKAACASGADDDRSDHVLLRVVMWQLRYSGTDVCRVLYRSVWPACTWCVVPPADNAAPAAESWHEIVVAPDLRFLPRCFVLAAASEWCRMKRRIAQRWSSRFWRESGYIQASMPGPVLADDVCGGPLVPRAWLW